VIENAKAAVSKAPKELLISQDRVGDMAFPGRAGLGTVI
jgi:hypothetical protein